MVWSWQLWLSPRPPQRTNIFTHQSSFVGAGNSARFDFLDEGEGRWGVRETHYIDHPLVRAGLSGPPLHVHLLQDEFFKVEKGVLGAITNEKEHVVTKDDGVLRIPAGTKHRFWCHESSKEDLAFHAWIDPQDMDHILDQNLLRHFQGYLADCEKAKLKPSIFQIILFSHESSNIMTPPFWMPLWLLTTLHHVLAYWIAMRFLGYKPTYPEYTVKPRSD